MSDIPRFPYDLLWGERSLKSVANLTRQDAVEFLDLAQRIPVRTHPVPYPLAEANRALDDLRAGRLQGAAVLVPRSEEHTSELQSLMRSSYAVFCLKKKTNT